MEDNQWNSPWNNGVFPWSIDSHRGAAEADPGTMEAHTGALKAHPGAAEVYHRAVEAHLKR
jgi:hypothetical protein